MQRSFTPLPQQRALVEWLQKEEKEVWKWFAEKEKSATDAEEVRLSILRDTYRLDAEVHPEVFREIEAACAALELDAAVFVYQAQDQSGPNASVCYLPGEAHVIFSGPILSLLSADELRGVIGHELSHQLLWQIEDGAFLLADRILHSAASHPQAEPAHANSARVWRLVTELYADRGAYLATGSLDAAVGGLVKTTTGLSQVSAKSYMAQAKEIFSKSKPKTDQFSHPETFIRARALQLWVEEEDDLEDTISRMLESGEGLDGLTLIQQSELAALTRRLLSHLLEPDWFQSDAILAHARQFFRGFEPAADEDIVKEVAELPAPHRDYLVRVMLDFCAVDPDLDEQPISRCLEIARDLGCLGDFEKLLTKELKLKAKNLKKLKEAMA